MSESMGKAQHSSEEPRTTLVDSSDLSPKHTSEELQAMREKRYDAIIIGGGHNALIAAAYLAKAGKSVLILEKESTLGGATVSQRVFPEFDARLSRYSYLVSLLPARIIEELELDFSTVGRSVASFTPDIRNGEHVGLLVETDGGEATRASFQALTNNSVEWDKWSSFYSEVSKIAQVIAPTLLEPLPTSTALKSKVEGTIWSEIVEAPLGKILESQFEDDLVRGVVLTDGLIGTHASAHDLAANRCFLYHLMGNGTGEWRVPVGGMGNLVTQLIALVKKLGVDLVVDAEVTEVVAAAGAAEMVAAAGSAEMVAAPQVAASSQSSNVSRSDSTIHFAVESSLGVFNSRCVLANCAPQVLSRIAGTKMPESLPGSQMKINMLLKKLPRLKSGVDPKVAFAGTFHIDERYSDLERAYVQSAQGEIPSKIPAEIYCHTLTDPSILSPELIAQGYHTLTLFGIHTPASLFASNHDEVKSEIVARLLAQMNEYLEDPVEDCLAVTSEGELCIEAKSPLELEEDISLPLGNIFHKDLSWPFKEDGDSIRWGVETEIPRLFLAGAGAIRGGGVSGIPGHNAAMAALELLN